MIDMTLSRHTRAALLAASLPVFALTHAAPVAAQSEATDAQQHRFSANLALVNDYRYRGLMQTNRRPAIQGGFDYSHASGFYAGNWNSSISWLNDSNDDVSASIEMDFYAGFKNTLGDGKWNYDFGVLQYYYPGDYPGEGAGGYVRPYTTEVYAGIGYGPVFLKYSYAPTNLFGFADSKNSWYLDLSANVPLNVWGLTLNAHVGYQKVQDGSDTPDASYTDWKVGLTKDLGSGFSAAVSYIDTNADRSVYTNTSARYLGKATVVGTISKVF